MEFEKQPLLEYLENNKKIVPALVCWKNINFTVKTPRKSLKILKNISGFANPGELTAIMGPSGSGKTSLLSILSQRTIPSTSYSLTGSLTINGKDSKSNPFHQHLKYLPQETHLFDFMTPFEILTFFISLKTGKSRKEVELKVIKILKKFRLELVKDTIIGNALIKGLSGGEKKRLAIASEVISRPSVLILDEPTSGLDSFMALSVIEILKSISRSGANVICSIHQPGFRIFQMIDRLIIMQDGNFVYSGRVGESGDHFRKAGFEIGKDLNPADFFMRILNIEDRFDIKRHEFEIMERLERCYKEDWENMKVLTGDEKLTELKYPKFFQSLKILVWRNFISVKRNPFITNAKIIQPLYFSALLCLTFHNLGKDNRGIEDRHGAILYFMNGIGFTPILILSIMIAYEKQLVSKEIREKLYSPLSYYLSIFLVEVPLAVISTLVVVSIIYFIVGFNQESADKFFIFYTISVCFLLSCLSAGALSGSLGQSSRDVLIISPLITVIFVLFSGIIVDIDSTPMVFRYIRYFLPLYYCHSGLIRNEFQGLDLNDDVNPEPDERFDYGSDISTSAFGLIGLAIGFWLAAVIISYATLVKR